MSWKLPGMVVPTCNSRTQRDPDSKKKKSQKLLLPPLSPSQGVPSAVSLPILCPRKMNSAAFWQGKEEDT